MVDVNDRFATKGANLILQPEAFSDWGFVSSPWAPDNFKEGGFANLQKLPELSFNVDASMTGQFRQRDLRRAERDHRPKAQGPAGPLGPDNAWIGQNPDTGFIRIAPWIEPDPGIANPGLTLAQRRSLLAADGSHLGTGAACADPLAVGPCGNGYRESVIWADLRLPGAGDQGPVDRTRARGRRTSSEAWRSARTATARAPRARRKSRRSDRTCTPSGTSAGTRTAPRRSGSPSATTVGATSTGGCASARTSHGGPDELHPSVAADQSEVVVAWQEFAERGNDDSGRIELAHFRPSRTPGRRPRAGGRQRGERQVAPRRRPFGRPARRGLDRRA